VQAISGQGGWPLNVFLTPQRKPFYGGTYYPPVPMHNRASWKDVLASISDAFVNRRDEIEQQAENLTQHIEASNNFGINPAGESGFTDALQEHVINKGKPTLGICVGMQLMAQKGHEAGEWDGLKWFDSEVVKLHPNDAALKVPNVGWCDTMIQTSFPLFKKLPATSVFYYVHSYYMQCRNEADVVAKYNFTHDVTAAIHKNNIVATQFHPEKSQDAGLQFLENFINWKP
ncbi:MAG: imidazole glycerol phosphate synthase subunit HisH, partial [Chitinophagaceae bacterium]